MNKEKLLEILDKHVDEKGLAKDLAFEILLPFLEKIVADSENKFDDIALGYVKEYIAKM